MMTYRERLRFRLQVTVIILLSWAVFVRWLDDGAAVKRRHIPKPAQNTCDKCGRFFVYFRLCRPKRFCSQPCATKFNNDHFNGIEKAARQEARTA